MKEFVEQPTPLLGGWAPCPYARQARINNQIKIEFIEAQGLCKEVYDNLHWLDSFDVLVLCFDHKKIDATLTQAYVKIMNSTLMKENVVILEDHPAAKEYVSGIKMNFGHCGLLVIQRLDKLNTASEQLQSKGYYDHWNKEALDEVVTWRFNK
jgi:hypothetical protein